MRRAEILAGLAVLLIGAPLAFMFASALADGEVRRQEAPLRGILGSDAFEALARGEQSDQHYLGNDRLAPDFTLQDREGRPWRLSDHRGQVIVLNFWTITCQPCVEEMPTLEELARIVAERDDIELVTISTDRTWDQVSTVVAPTSPLTVLLDPDKAVVRDRFGTRLYPETWVIDRDGVIRLRVDGPREWSSAIAVDAIESFL
ncbi:TlpA family protein disulfide reductase [Sandaracinus amylolyticus]|uniref:Thioredoxin family protein n=1 Tax=Sandaracinus amylolyticus TaxID=927083 RepID=A0A0F6YL53_9BACT|nr:TlpA disulfide reductase family protein [Sandaracinus amylolyticus]AKF08932.1 thioredoxin family protein [Sandaracinus amylolyticus]